MCVIDRWFGCISFSPAYIIIITTTATNGVRFTSVRKLIINFFDIRRTRGKLLLLFFHGKTIRRVFISFVLHASLLYPGGTGRRSARWKRSRRRRGGGGQLRSRIYRRAVHTAVDNDNKVPRRRSHVGRRRIYAAAGTHTHTHTSDAVYRTNP